MAEIAPFNGIFYNKGKIGDIMKVVAPPYDVISDEEREKYYNNSESNIIRIILGKDSPGDDKENNRYSRAEKFMLKWLDEGILKRDDKPAIYLLEQEYGLPDGSRKVRKGFISLVKLDQYNWVRPHEKTLSGPREDRLRLFRSCRSNFSPIFTFYSDPSKSAGEIIAEKEKSEPDMILDSIKGVRESLWKINEEGLVRKLVEMMKSKMFYIADGHHRYATALNYQSQMKAANPGSGGDEPYNYTMVYFTNMEDEGITIFPTHRMVRDLPDFNIDVLMKKLELYFDIISCGGREDMLKRLSDSDDNSEIGMYTGGDNFFVLKPGNENVLNNIIKGRPGAYYRLNVAVLHELVMNRVLNVSGDTFKNIVYSKDVDEVIKKVKEGSVQAGFMLKPIGISELRDVVESGELMPRKATYFFPKLLSGMVINRIK